MRAAIFFTPPADDPLTIAAAAWLGRDAFTGAAIPQPLVPGFGPHEIAALTAAPRRYGFHATLKAPFRLADGVTQDELVHALRGFAYDTPPVTLGALRIARLSAFFALVPDGDTAAVDALAEKAVRHFEPHRAPLTTEEIERRRPADLTPTQRENLVRWGYPYVFGDFRFHMTLTGPVPEARQPDLATPLAERFGPLLARPVHIDTLSLFIEPEPDADFRVRHTAAMARTAEPAGAA